MPGAIGVFCPPPWLEPSRSRLKGMPQKDLINIRNYDVRHLGRDPFNQNSNRSDREKRGAIHSTKISGNFGPKLNGSVRSNRKSFEKTGPPFEVVLFSRSDRLEFWLNGSRPRTTSKGGPVFSKLFRLDRTDPLSFGPKFPEILVEWIAPLIPKVCSAVLKNGAEILIESIVK